MSTTNSALIRHDWQPKEVRALFEQPLIDTVFQAQSIHRQLFDPNEIQLSTLLNVKEGGCPEDCAYCPQSQFYQTGVRAHKLLGLEEVLSVAKKAQDNGATRFCMGAAWRELKDRDLAKITQMIQGVKQLGLETCVSLGMLGLGQAQALKAAGLDYYNHNLDSSESFYKRIISTRTYRDRLDTLACIREAGIQICCGGIIGMGESLEDRSRLLINLSNLPTHPQSVPINVLVKVEGTPLAQAEDLHPFDLVRTVAVARIMMPKSYIRLSAGRSLMSDEQQALCFLAGANSVFFGDKLLTTENPVLANDRALFKRLGLRPQS
ncbi:MAG: biotin synthase BioB [Gammaproteobacteria bacterium]